MNGVYQNGAGDPRRGGADLGEGRLWTTRAGSPAQQLRRLRREVGEDAVGAGATER